LDPEYRKNSFVVLENFLLLPNLALPPTTLQWEVDLGVDDYRRKHTRKAGPFLTLPPFYTTELTNSFISQLS